MLSLKAEGAKESSLSLLKIAKQVSVHVLFYNWYNEILLPFRVLFENFLRAPRSFLYGILPRVFCTAFSLSHLH